MEDMKSIAVISSIMVRPAEETPKETILLSWLDCIRRQPYSHNNVLYIYQPNKTPQNTSTTTFFDVDVLRKSLSKALVPFYTMAGRVKLHKNNRYEIDCNAEGALFNEAETTYTITDLGNGVDPKTDIRKGLFPHCDYSKELSTIPLLMVQATRFKCGGVCLGFSQHHHVADGLSHVHFINSWGRLARGLEITVLPIHDRLAYVAPRDPPQFKDLDPNYMEPSLPPMELPDTITKSTTESTFLLSKAQIDGLMHEAMSSQDDTSSDKLTTFTVLAGHVWRSACKARKLPDDQDVKLYMPVSGRTILNNPKFPLGYCGNVILCASNKAEAGDIMHNPLSYAAHKACEAVSKMKDPECFRSAIDFIETHPNFEPLIRGEYHSTCPNLSINSWAKLPVNESDFGWGPPKFIRHGGVTHEGQSAVIPSDSENGSLLLNIRLFTAHMALFEKYLYEFDSSTGYHYARMNY